MVFLSRRPSLRICGKHRYASPTWLARNAQRSCASRPDADRAAGGHLTRTRPPSQRKQGRTSPSSVQLQALYCDSYETRYEDLSDSPGTGLGHPSRSLSPEPPRCVPRQFPWPPANCTVGGHPWTTLLPDGAWRFALATRIRRWLDKGAAQCLASRHAQPARHGRAIHCSRARLFIRLIMRPERDRRSFGCFDRAVTDQVPMARSPAAGRGGGATTG